MSDLINDLVLLQNWAPQVLQLGRLAKKEELLEIIQLRARVESLVLEAVEAGEAAPFFMLVNADRACAPLCGTLLFLSSDEALEAVQEPDSLNPLSWCGVHFWDITKVIPNWTRQINETTRVDAHPAETLGAFLSQTLDWGTEYSNNWFTTPEGEWRTPLDLEDQTQLAERILKQRESSTHQPGETW